MPKLTADLVDALTEGTDAIEYQPRMEALAQMVRVAKAALVVAEHEPIFVFTDTDGRGVVECTICRYKSEPNATIRHRQECAWFQLDLAVTGHG